MGKGLKWIATFMVAWILVLGVMVGKVEAAGNNVHGPSGSGYEYICIENHESNPVISTYNQYHYDDKCKYAIGSIKY